MRLASTVSFSSVCFSSSRIAKKRLQIILQPEQLGPGGERAIDRNLVVLDPLRRGDQAGIAQVLILDHAGPLLGFLTGRRAGTATWLRMPATL